MVHSHVQSLRSFIFSPLFPASLLIMSNVFSSKRKKLPLHSKLHFSHGVPHLTTASAQAKYRIMRHNLSPGNVITFNSFPDLFEKIKNVGWDCLVTFYDKYISPGLISEFYTHMESSKNLSGLLTSITTCIHGQVYVIDEHFLINALHLHPSTLELPRVNSYLHSSGIFVEECMLFKHNLSIVADQMVPALLFDYPYKVGLEFLTAKSQFLGKILRNNFMLVREDRKLLPFDLELIKSILNECMPYNLAYFLLSSFEFCFHNNCLGFGLLLTHIFNYLELNVSQHQSQLVPTSNIVSHLNLPPQSLIVFKPFDPEVIESNINMVTKIDSLNSMNQLLLQNQNFMIEKLEDMQLSLHTVKSMVCFMMENNRLLMNPYQFPANSNDEPVDHVPPLFPGDQDDNILEIAQHFSLNLEDI